MEAWFTLMTEAAKGAQGAQEAFQSLAKVSHPADLGRWMRTFMPGLAGPALHQQAQTLEAWLEEWWRIIGVVPRARYLELLEKHDALRRELEKAQKAIRKLHETLGHKGEPYAKNILDVWNAMLDETLKVQAEWIRVWKGTGERNAEFTGQADEGKSENRS